MKTISKSITDKYFCLWALVLPITSFVLFSLKGATLGYLFAFFCLLWVPFISQGGEKKFLQDLLIFFLVFIFLNTLGQLFLGIGPSVDFSDLKMVHAGDDSFLLRTSMFTQSLYLLAAILTFLYVKSFYKLSWDKYIYIGIIFLALYGIYEVSYYAIFHENGDFMTNRIFGEDEDDAIVNGSAFQVVNLGAVALQRLKSLTGEPSMYAFSVLPFWIYAVHNKQFYIQGLLLITLVLSMSGTAILGICVYGIGRLFYYGVKDRFNWSLIGCGLITIFIFIDEVSIIFDSMILAKVSLEHISGLTRYSEFQASMDFFSKMYLPSQFFGIGFGYIRSTDMLTTLLVNNGIIGFFLFTILFFYPIVKLPRDSRAIGLKLALIVVYVLMMILVPEFAYLPSWLFLGIAYNRLNEVKE